MEDGQHAEAAGDSAIEVLADPSGVVPLLSACGLPVEDIGPGTAIVFLGVRRGSAPVAVVGLESCGTACLLRSLAVAPQARRAGLGTALVARAEAEAARGGMRNLYLLTTDAARFFDRLGFRPADRSEAPPAIRATAQFSGLCPDSSTFMAKALGHRESP